MIFLYIFSGAAAILLIILVFFLIKKEKKIKNLLHLIERVPVPIFFKDKNCKFTGCNKAFETLLWKEKEKILGKTVFDLFGMDIAEFLNEKESDIIEHGGEHQFEFVFSHVDGTEHKVLCHLSLEGGLKGNGIIGAFVDITTRYLLEKKLQYLNDDYALLLDNGPIQMWYFKDVDIYGKINNSHARFLGLAKELAENTNIYDILTKEDAKELSRRIKHVYCKKKKTNVEIYLHNKQGEEKLFYTIMTPIIDELNNVKNVFCAAIEIPE